MTSLKAISILSLVLFQLSARAEIGVTESTILLGSSMPITGLLEKRTKDIQLSTQVVFNKINKTGGVFGRKIEVAYLDDRYDPKVTAENTKALLQNQKPFFLFNYLGVPAVQAAKPIIEQANIPLITPLNGSVGIRTPAHPLIFALRPGCNVDAVEMANFIANNLKKKRIGIFYQDDAFGLEGKTEVNKAMVAHKMRIEVEGKYTRGTEDFAGQIDKMMAAKPDVVIVWAPGPNMIKFIKEANLKGFKPIFMGPFASFGPDTIAELSNQTSDLYMAISIPFYGLTPPVIAQQYVKDITDEKGTPSLAGFEAYLNAKLIVEMLQKSGQDLTRENFKKAFEETAQLDLGGINVSYGKNQHVGINSAYMVQVKNGKVISLK